MKLQLLVLILSLVLTACTADAADVTDTSVPVTLTIAFDKSASNPLLSDPNFAASAAEYAAELVGALKEGDTVRIRNFGARDVASNMLDQEFVISRRLRPQQAAAAVASYIASLPQQAAQAQSSTNIVAFLEFDSGLDCENGGKVHLLTDGVESSTYVSSQSFLDGSQSLPTPDVDLTGCHVEFYGLGAGLPPQSVRFMRKEWTNYVTAAGGKFTSIVK